tara:strand:- start:856 stop:1131 length:276 start_codon:yes stop_codon:yes gene_type:complete
MDKTTTPYNFTPVDKNTLTIDLVNAVKSLVHVYENPWQDTRTSHTEQIQNEIKYTKEALQAYDRSDRTKVSKPEDVNWLNGDWNRNGLRNY